MCCCFQSTLHHKAFQTLPLTKNTSHLPSFKMRASTPLLFAAAALAAPAPSNNLFARGTAGLDATVYDQGDGFYAAVFNESTSAVDVVFTPLSEVDLDTTRPEALPQLDTRALGKRDTTCSGAVSFDTPTLDAANVELANNANNRWYEYKAWGWVCSPPLPVLS
jgi:hypothetical protein